MEPDRIRTQDDLRGLIDGEVFCDEIFSQLYATDASIYEVPPLGVVRPRNTDDVVKCVQYAVEHGLALFPRGAGTGLAGESIGRGLILDFSRFMRRLINFEAPRATVQPGLVLAELNRTLGQSGYLFGPDPATRSVTTIGSSLSVDSSGSHFPKYGTVGDRLESLQVVLASGEVVRLSKQPYPPTSPPSSTLERLAAETGELIEEHRELLADPPWGAVARGAGYRLERVLRDGQVDLSRLMAGSEGTLAIITEATILVDPIPRARGVAMLFFERLEGAARAALEAAASGVSACDLVDRRLMEIARETDTRYETLLPKGAEAMLLVEYQGDEAGIVRERLNELVHRLQRMGKWLMSARLTTDRSERDLFWRVCRRVIPRLYRLKGSTRPLPFVEDISIPPTKLPEFLFEAQNVLKAERVTATVFGHAAHGQLHIRPFLDLSDPSQVAKMERLAENLYEKVWECGGTICGEHAWGLSRSWFAERQFGPRLELCRKVKRLFDPGGVLNPGKFAADHPQRLIENLRPVAASNDHVESVSVGDPMHLRSATRTVETVDFDPLSSPAIDFSAAETSKNVGIVKERPPLPLLLDWDSEQQLGLTARSCNGCGRCRTTSNNERMCPVFRVGYGEEASPRAKANLMRAVFSGRLPAQLLEGDAVKKIADLCFHCHQCRVECPASVDIPKLMVEAKAQYVATNGLRFGDSLLTRLDRVGKLASRFPKIANWILSDQRARWILEKTIGLAQGRKLPRYSRRTFTRWAVRQRLHRPTKSRGKKVLFFVDQYVNWHNPMLGRALVEVLRHQRIDVYVPPEQNQSFMAKIALGDIERARKLIRPNIKLLAEAVRQGYEIVTTEPSAALCLQHEYRQLWDDEETQLISEHSWEACRYLMKLHQANELELDFRPLPINVVYHQPCHLRALDSSQSGLRLLDLIPGLSVQSIEGGCSGMAGTFGLKKENYRNSLRIGWGVISTMQKSTAQVGSTECTACKLQMEQAVSTPTIHPIALLAYAYGHVPEIGNWLQSRNEGLLVT